MQVKNGGSIVSRIGFTTAVALIAGSTAAFGQAADAPETFPLSGVMRDFAPSHPDFNTDMADGLFFSAGNIASELDADGFPVYQGGGSSVITRATDSAGRSIAPSLAKIAPLTSFTITGATVTSTKTMYAKVTVIGAALETTDGFKFPVATQTRVGTTLYAPFGSFSSATLGNVNDNNNPRSYIVPGAIAPGTALSIDGRSWDTSNSGGSGTSWVQKMTVNALSGGGQVVALRNGSAVPNVAGAGNQASAKELVGAYIDTATNKIKLKDNQVIYLFELWTTSTGSSAFDLQDLVVLVDLATDAAHFTTPSTSPPPAPCVTVDDTPAVMGVANTGGISSPETFAHWFKTIPGQNASALQTINMTRESDGAYAFRTPDFHPIDGELYGNQGMTNNRGFSFSIDAEATYKQCSGQYFEYAGDGDVWVFVNGKLVMDMGGRHAGASQQISLDRLGLTDGEPARIQFFYAQRGSGPAPFAMRTNMVMSTSAKNVAIPGVTGLTD